MEALSEDDGRRPEIVLFTVRENVGREEMNATIREKGLSPLHNIRRVETIPEMPLLGSGKIHYRKLKAAAD